MLNINYYVEKQYLIVELKGKLIKKHQNRFAEVTSLIKDLQINNLIINTHALKKIDDWGLEKLLYCYNLTYNYFEKQNNVI